MLFEIHRTSSKGISPKIGNGSKKERRRGRGVQENEREAYGFSSTRPGSVDYLLEEDGADFKPGDWYTNSTCMRRDTKSFGSFNTKEWA